MSDPICRGCSTTAVIWFKKYDLHYLSRVLQPLASCSLSCYHFVICYNRYDLHLSIQVMEVLTHEHRCIQIYVYIYICIYWVRLGETV